MNKILKLTGVSMLAIVTATGARAAGYTCEELVVYESCNPGYYYGSEVSGTSTVCPGGYTMYTNGICIEHYEETILTSVTSEEDCYYEDPNNENAAEWIEGPVCVSGDQYTTELVEGDIYTDTCVLCPVGSICAGGDVEDAVAEPCPAGSYCKDTGLSAVSGVCAVGSYSTGGATQCTKCPSAPMKDKDGNIVITTTESTGATSFSACYIDKNAYFADDKGIYHFNQNCTFNENDEYGLDFYESADGTCINGYIYGETGEGNIGCFRLPSTEEECSNADYGNGIYWDGKECICPFDFTIEWIGDLRC